MIVSLSDGTLITTIAQLRAERRWASYSVNPIGDLWILPATHWKRVAQSAAFKDADIRYESAKSDLVVALKGLTAEQLAEYFAALVPLFTPAGATKAAQVDDYLARA